MICILACILLLFLLYIHLVKVSGAIAEVILKIFLYHQILWLLWTTDDRPRASVTNLAEASEGMLHLFGTETATPTSGFALHECHGTSLAKKRCIEERGWRVVVIPYSVWKNLDTPEAKQKVLQDAIVSGGFQDGMNSLFRSAVRR